MASETKAQRVERIKREKDGLDVLEDILRYARSNETVDPEDIDRFKWYGLYTQNRHQQEAEDETLYFMLRVKVEGGYLNPKQVGVLGEIAREYAQDSADLTTRQDIQFHWIQVRDLPEIFERLHGVGLSTQEAAGDCPRNIVCCPVNGMDQEQIDDVRDIVATLNDLYRANREFSNLPRKFKIGVCGCGRHCIHPEVQDLAFTAYARGDEGIAFSVSVGGGQASNRRLADSIGWVKRGNVPRIAEAVGRIYRDFGRRDNRAKARLGHVVESMGKEAFTVLLERESGVVLGSVEPIALTSSVHRGHFGVHPSTVSGKKWIGCAVAGGRIGGMNLTRLSQTLEFYAAEGITLTTAQNFVIHGVPEHLGTAMAETLDGIGLSARPGVFEARTQACTGLEFCKFAVSETKNRSLSVIEQLNRRFGDFSEPIGISINGCPNMCAHPVISDLGFVGANVEREGVKTGGFELLVGGYLEGEKSRFARKTGIKVAADEVGALIEALIGEYERGPKTDFREFLVEKYCHEPDFSTPS